MSELPPLPTIELGRYRHYKGGEYQVTGVVRHSETLEPLVLYRPLYNSSGSWVRPFAMFLEPIEHDGRIQTRFTLVDPGVPASEEQLVGSVRRMETTLGVVESREVQQLMGLYRTMRLRLEHDPAPVARDLLLAKAGALMLVQAVASAPSAKAAAAN